MRGRFLSLIAFAALGGCVAIDTGYIDYRRADDVDALRDAARYRPYCNFEKSDPRSGDEQRRQINVREAGDPKVCYPLLGAKLHRKNMAGSGKISAGDIYSIRLDHGYMQFVSEFPFRPDRIFSAKNPFRAQAEIVVLARAFEFSAKPAEAPKPAPAIEGTPSPAPAPTPAGNANDFVNLSFDSLNSARVIYYSPDVENGQGLNFSNIPILGPVRYGGQPVGIQIIVLELDRISPEMQGLLSSLASLGQTAGALPTGGAAGILMDLGKSLLESNQDDVIFEYRFVLDPNNAPNSYNSAPLETGRYVLRRLQSRDAAPVWRNLLLDHNTGQLFLMTDDTKTKEAAEPYERETYFTVNIFKNGEGVREADYVQRSFKELSDAIMASASARDEPMLRSTLAAVKKEQQDLLGAQAVLGLATLWEKIVDGANSLAYGFPPETSQTPAGCVINAANLQGKRKTEYEMARDANQFVRDWQLALADPKTMTFGASEQGRVKDMVAGFFLSTAAQGKPGIPGIDTFLSDVAFKSFLETSFAQSLPAYVEAVRPKTCDDLLAAGLATPS